MIEEKLSIFETILLRENVVTLAQLTSSKKENALNHNGLLFNLVTLGYIPEDSLLQKLQKIFNLPIINHIDTKNSLELVDLVGISNVMNKHIVPIKQVGNVLTIATDDPTDLYSFEEIKLMTGLNITLVIASPTSLRNSIQYIRLAIKLSHQQGSSNDFLNAAIEEGIDFEGPDSPDLDEDSFYSAESIKLDENNENESNWSFDSSLDDSNELENLEALALEEESIEFGETSTDLPMSAPDAKDEITSVAVYFATDRLRDDKADSGNELFTGQRNESNTLSYGRCAVSIPKDHRIGHVERPSWLRLEFSENPQKHIMIMNLIEHKDEGFYKDIDSYLVDSSEDSALVFVHGYNVSFPDSILRTAQISYDLNFQGVTLAYTWPSTGKVKGYLTDANNARWSEPHLEKFLQDLRDRTGVTSINIIAHSMGSRILAAALKDVAEDFKSDQVVFAAPDVDADVFKELTSGFHHKVNRITLYASSNDEALKLSRKLQGGYARAGETTNGVNVFANVDSIDATQVNTGLLGHSYYGDSRSIVSDIFHLIRQDIPPSNRFGMYERLNEKGDIYWEFKP